LDLHQSLAHQGLAKSLDISIGMPTLFANLAASRSRHISSQKIAQLRLKYFLHSNIHYINVQKICYFGVPLERYYGTFLGL
ncbi:MAG: hypothetical protein U9Q84_04375, partial [Thermodesulfobacteriota bacterium]|nr:hypothetical protein [Thermodesulfobacteriota bacterium]